MKAIFTGMWEGRREKGKERDEMGGKKMDRKAERRWMDEPHFVIMHTLPIMTGINSQGHTSTTVIFIGNVLQKNNTNVRYLNYLARLLYWHGANMWLIHSMHCMHLHTCDDGYDTIQRLHSKKGRHLPV